MFNNFQDRGMYIFDIAIYQCKFPIDHDYLIL